MPKSPRCFLFSTTREGFVRVRKVHAVFAKLLTKMAKALPLVRKEFGENRSFHYAPDGILAIIRIKSGQHTLKCFSKLAGGGVRLLTFTLNAGDYAVFYDYPPEADRQKTWEDEFSETIPRSGHKSQPGPEGVEIEGWTINLSELSDLEFDFLKLSRP